MFLSLFLLLGFLPAHAGTGEVFIDMLAPPGRPKLENKISFTTKVYQATSVHGTSYTADENRQTLESSFLLSETDHQKWKLFIDGGRTAIQTPATFGGGQAIPSLVWGTSIGGAWIKKLEDKTLAVTAAVSSPSDQPIHSLRETSADLNVIYKIPRSETSNLLLFLSFSQTRGFLDNIPLPGLAYQFRARDNLGFVLGIPFLSMDWQPFDKTLLLLNYYPSKFGQVKFSYILFGPAQIYLQANYQGKSYFLKNRGSNSERFFTEEGNLNGGFTMPLTKFLLADFTIGKTFERKYFMAEKSSEWRNNDKLRRLESGTEAALKLLFLL